MASATEASIFIRPLLTAEHFGARHLGKIVGAAWVVVNPAAISPAVSGSLFDATGSYRIPFAVAAVVALAAALAFLFFCKEHSPASCLCGSLRLE